MQIGRYEIEGEIARGGMGAVFRARGPGGRAVAIKVLLNAASARGRKRFLREGRALAKLRHPNLVAVHEVGECEVGPYLVMEYVEGESLHHRLEKELLTPAEAVRLSLGVAEALAHCHAAGVIHRDLKPGNVLINLEGEACLTDFGLAHDADPELSRLSKSGTYIGSPGFWPPEQATGDLERLGAWSDVYAFGATLHAMLTGEPPFEFDSVVSAVIAALEQAPAKSGVDRHLDRLIADCLEKVPERRPEIDEVIERLAAWSPTGASERTAVPWRKLAVAGLVALGLTGVGVGVGVGVSAHQSAEPAEDRSVPRVVAPWESELSPEAWALLQEARAAFRRGDHQGAVDRYQAAQRAAPNTSRLHALRAVSLVRLKREEEALVELDQAIALDPDDAQVRYNRGALRCELGQANGALEDLDRVLAKMPTKGRAWFARGAVNYQLGRYDQSIADHDRAEALLPRHVPNIMSRAASREAKGDLVGALRDYDKALRIRPKNAETLGERAVLRVKTGDLKGGLLDFTAALELRPQDGVLLARRGRALIKAGDLKGAHADFSAALEVRPKDAGLWEYRGLVRYKLGDAQGARTDFEQALKWLPKGDKRGARIRLWLSKVEATIDGG